MRRGSACLVLSLSVVAFLTVQQSVFAASGYSQPLSQKDAALVQAFTPDEIQAVRDQLSTITGDLQQIQTMIGHPPDQRQVALTKSQQASLTDVDIARWLAAGVDLAPLQKAVETAMAKTAVAELRTQRGAISPLTTAGFPDAQYGSICSGYTSNSDVVFSYQTALNVAKLAWIPIKDACDQVAVVAGEGGNTSLACIIPDGVLQAAELILAEYTICDGDTQSAQVAGNYARLAYINEQIDSDYQATVSNDNANTATLVADGTANTNTIVANDNANKAAIIANDNANTASVLSLMQANQGQTVSLLIQQNLATSGPAIGDFELPVASGGHLETARDIVANLITSLQSVGQGVGNAPGFLNQGNTYFSQGQYKQAYAKYRLAYQAATNQGT